MNRAVLLAACLVVFLALSAGLPRAMAQTQNGAQTGVGGTLEALRALQEEAGKQWDGRLGQVAKGAGGLAGLAASLMAARDALTFQLRIRGDGSVDAVGANETSATSTAEAASVSTSTSTN